jgi:hypothetical protein
MLSNTACPVVYVLLERTFRYPYGSRRVVVREPLILAGPPAVLAVYEQRRGEHQLGITFRGWEPYRCAPDRTGNIGPGAYVRSVLLGAQSKNV